MSTLRFQECLEYRKRYKNRVVGSGVGYVDDRFDAGSGGHEWDSRDGFDPS